MDEQGEPLVTFHFLPFPLFDKDAQPFLEQHIACMYPALPTMRGANVNKVIQAVNEMKVLYRDNPKLLYEQLAIMEALMERSTTLSEEDKARLAKDAIMSDPLMDNYSRFQRRLTEEKAKAHAEAHAEAEKEIEEAKAKFAKAEAEIRAKAEKSKVEMERNFLTTIAKKYPELLDSARTFLACNPDLDSLLEVFGRVVNASDIAAVREIFAQL
jgi:hypothetical protein